MIPGIYTSCMSLAEVDSATGYHDTMPGWNLRFQAEVQPQIPDGICSVTHSWFGVPPKHSLPVLSHFVTFPNPSKTASSYNVPAQFR